jgi:hypothetical protein
MAKTMVDLTSRALQKLRIIGAEESPAAADAALVQLVYQAKLQELELRGVAAFAYNAIPDAYFEALAHWLAASVAVDFGRMDYEDDETALRKLRRATAKPYIGDPEPINYF